MQLMKKILLGAIFLILLVIIAILIFAPKQVDKRQNKIQSHPRHEISERTQALHDSLVIGDWHADSLLWNRDLSKHNDYGHLDIPRLQQGNVGLQMFTTVTKSPSGQNYHHNDSDANDRITQLALVQRWPIKAWSSLKARAIYQAKKLHKLQRKNSNDLLIIKSKKDLASWQERRQQNSKVIGALLGTEGSHALDGDLNSVQELFDHGFRMMSLQHFFDNKLGGSLHGSSQSGLSDFGRQAIKKMNQLNIIIDVSHSSESVVEDVLNLSEAPLVVSHTGFKGHCDTERNISDVLMEKIAVDGGLIAVGYWDAAVCGTTADDIAEAIIYGIELVGENNISLGSDFDGSVTTGFDTSEIALMTQALVDLGVSEGQIRKVMGGNMLRFLGEYLPD